ncbi:MAG TPA: hypothetical protein VK620_06045, partial [Bradyrhizobium sp.]|nr:hypothetical protein [Bradyrhizobium sp.]
HGASRIAAIGRHPKPFTEAALRSALPNPRGPTSGGTFMDKMGRTFSVEFLPPDFQIAKGPLER